MDALNLGVLPGALVIRDVIRHEQTGLLVDPARGVIYGRQGSPVGWECADGYVRLGGKRRQAYQYAHRLIWELANGPIPSGLQIDHVNGRKTDNRLRNLDLVTQSENVRRALANGLMPRGEARAEAKLTDELVRQIRLTVGEVSNTEWARRLGVERSTIRCARVGKSWRHVALRGRADSTKRTTRRNRGRK